MGFTSHLKHLNTVEMDFISTLSTKILCRIRGSLTYFYIFERKPVPELGFHLVDFLSLFQLENCIDLLWNQLTNINAVYRLL